MAIDVSATEAVEALQGWIRTFRAVEHLEKAARWAANMEAVSGELTAAVEKLRAEIVDEQTALKDAKAATGKAKEKASDTIQRAEHEAGDIRAKAEAEAGAITTEAQRQVEEQQQALASLKLECEGANDAISQARVDLDDLHKRLEDAKASIRSLLQSA
jgi:chromosome segregation ATPase